MCSLGASIADSGLESPAVAGDTRRAMPYFALTYDVVDDYLERRAPLRAEHLRLATEFVESGSLVLAGLLDEPPDRALLVFRAADRSTVEAFVARDPYVREGLVRRWTVRPWTAVVGTALEPGA